MWGKELDEKQKDRNARIINQFVQSSERRKSISSRVSRSDENLLSMMSTMRDALAFASSSTSSTHRPSLAKTQRFWEEMLRGSDKNMAIAL